MKKILHVFLFLCLTVLAFGLVSTKLSAEGEQPVVTATSTIRFHFAAKNANYSDGGMHTWTYGQSEDTASFPAKWDGTDEFGAYFDLTIDNTAADTVGYIALLEGMSTNTQWDHKSYGSDIMVSTTALKAKGGSYDRIDVYNFQGTKEIFVAYPDMANVLVVYYDPSASYEENLGMHVWGDAMGAEYNAAGVACAGSWGTPDQVFLDLKDAEGENANTLLKATMFNVPVGKSVGGLIYAGDDASKKAPQLTDAEGAPWGDKQELNVAATAENAGTTSLYLVTGGIAFNNWEAFVAKAYAFAFTGYRYNNGDMTGTYAPNPTSIMVEFDSAVAISEQTASYFSLKEGENVVEIERVDYDKGDTSASQFVVVPATPLDNTKNYMLYYNDGAEKSAEIDVAMDKEAPEITVPGTTEIPLGQPFDFAYWDEASIVITDDRTLNISYYCKAGDECTIDTNVVGEQKVKIYAKDAWGNEAHAYMVFNVVGTAPVEGDSCQQQPAAASLLVPFFSALSVAAVLIIKRRLA